MSYFSVCVVVPNPELTGTICDNDILESCVYELLAPYEESTENPEYQEFIDKTDEAKKEYESKRIQVAKCPNGKIISTWSYPFYDKYIVDNGVILERFDLEHGGNHETAASKQYVLIPDYPVKDVYSFEEYCAEYCSYTQASEDRWGYYCNPNATWDWYSIGGRFPGRLLVKKDAADILRLPESEEKDFSHPDGYLWVNGARMRDIEWQKMHELKVEGVKNAFARLSEAFSLNDSTNLGPLATITEDGIAGWGEMLYIKGETLEEYMTRRGATGSDLKPIDTFAFVNADGVWFASGNVGWFGIASNEKPERTWLDELKSLTDAIEPDDFLVIVDCHI